MAAKPILGVGHVPLWFLRLSPVVSPDSLLAGVQTDEGGKPFVIVVRFDMDKRSK